MSTSCNWNRGLFSRHNGILAECVIAGYDQMLRVMMIQNLSLKIISVGVTYYNDKQVEFNLTFK